MKKSGKTMSKKKATITRTIVHEDGSKTYENFGVVFESTFPGVYALIEEIDTDEKDDNGYPVRSRIVARKAANGEKIIDSPREDGARVFYNLTVWETMEAKPPRN